MRILHISDLHFGNHNESLAENLKDVTADLKPDLILATGDLADQPTNDLLVQSRDFLRELESRCASKPEKDPKRPQVMVVPGNHDVRYLGNFRYSSRRYTTVFNENGWPKSYYFQPENVWIYGFDSSLELKTGANGRVPERDLRRFAQEYKHLQDRHKERFDQAVKIAAIHHHPLPIKYDDTVSRWLVLTNAAEFLGEMLKVKIDLIVHGHEHIRARVHYGKELRTGGHREIPVVSVGTTLKSEPGTEPNCLYMIGLEDFGVVRVQYYGAEGDRFDRAPLETFEVISTAKAKDKFFDASKQKEGFSYGSVASIAKINRDGDAFRVVECHDLSVDTTKVTRASSHIAPLPATSGYLDMAKASVIRGSGFLNFRHQPFKTTRKNEVETGEMKIDYGRTLTKSEKLSYGYSWYAVNAFAMNEREARFKYSPESFVEFTSYPVVDPIEELTVIAQFPDELLISEQEPQPRVVKSGTSDEDSAQEEELRASKALHYYETLGTVALRVAKPFVGYSYGIQWKIPPSRPAPKGAKAGKVEDLVAKMIRARSHPTEESRSFLCRFLFTVTELMRTELINGAKEVWEAGLMAFDQRIRRMIVVGSATVGGSIEECAWKDFTAVEFRYGEGIGGKVFKANQPRLYVKLTDEEEKQRTTPNFYLPVEGMPHHAVLLSMPLQNPDDVNHVYAVLNFGELTRSGQFWELGQPGGPIGHERFGTLQASLNKLSFELLSREFPT